MKKSVIMIILAVYLVSVCIVGFFGIEIKPYETTVNVEQIVIKDVFYEDQKLEIKVNDEGKKFVKAKYDENKTFKIFYDILPTNATNQEVNIVYEDTLKGVEVTKAPGEFAFYVKIDIAQFGGKVAALDIKVADENLVKYDIIRLQVLNRKH